MNDLTASLSELNSNKWLSPSSPEPAIDTVELKSDLYPDFYPESATGAVQLKSSFFNSRSLKIKNMHKLSLVAEISYQTIHRYFNTPNISTINGTVLYAIIIGGMGLSIEEAENLRLGDVFEFIDKD